jgi:hypothetical protein
VVNKSFPLGKTMRVRDGELQVISKFFEMNKYKSTVSRHELRNQQWVDIEKLITKKKSCVGWPQAESQT